MRIGDADPLTNKPIKIGRGNLVLRVMSLDVSHAKIVGQNHDDVGWIVRGDRPGDQAARRRHNDETTP